MWLAYDGNLPMDLETSTCSWNESVADQPVPLQLWLSLATAVSRATSSTSTTTSVHAAVQSTCCASKTQEPLRITHKPLTLTLLNGVTLAPTADSSNSLQLVTETAQARHTNSLSSRTEPLVAALKL
jgi:hypothetical protein